MSRGSLALPPWFAYSQLTTRWMPLRLSPHTNCVATNTAYHSPMHAADGRRRVLAARTPEPPPLRPRPQQRGPPRQLRRHRVHRRSRVTTRPVARRFRFAADTDLAPGSDRTVRFELCSGRWGSLQSSRLRLRWQPRRLTGEQSVGIVGDSITTCRAACTTQGRRIARRASRQKLKGPTALVAPRSLTVTQCFATRGAGRDRHHGAVCGAHASDGDHTMIVEPRTNDATGGNPNWQSDYQQVLDDLAETPCVVRRRLHRCLLTRFTHTAMAVHA